MRSIKMLVALAVVAVAPLAAQDAAKPELQPPATLTSSDSARFLGLGKTYTRWFLTGKADSLATAMSAESLERLGGVDRIRQQQDMIAERAGTQTKVTEEKLTRRMGRLQYWHAGQFSELPGEDFIIRWLLDENGKIVGAGLGPRSSTPPVD